MRVLALPVIVAVAISAGAADDKKPKISVKANPTMGMSPVRVVVTADLIGFGDEFTQAVRDEIARRAGGPLAAVLLCASHTHYGPVTGAYERSDEPPEVAAYVQNLKFQLAGAAQAALAAVEPVRVGFGRGASSIGVNRRERPTPCSNVRE